MHCGMIDIARVRGRACYKATAAVTGIIAHSRCERAERSAGDDTVTCFVVVRQAGFRIMVNPFQKSLTYRVVRSLCSVF